MENKKEENYQHVNPYEKEKKRKEKKKTRKNNKKEE
jgi:hypothetical protein